MKKFTCPYCYDTHGVNDLGMKCSYNIIGNADKHCIANVTKDPRGWIPNIEKAKCINCKAARKTLFCPVVSKEIPTDFLSSGNMSVALLGAKASGKSNYIGVIINEIKRKMTSSFNCSLSLTSSEESKRYYDDHYYEPLFLNKTVVDATSQEEIPPLIFPLRFFNKKNKIAKVAALSFYDTAGENLDSPDQMDIYNKYIPNAKGIILLLDPLQIPMIRQKLQGQVELPAQNTDAQVIVSRIEEIIRRVKNVTGNIKTPLALVFTKIDVLEKYNILSDNSYLKSESDHLKRGVFVQADFESVHSEIEDLIENWLDDGLLSTLKCFENRAYFGVSSLGDAPQRGRLSGSGIKPRRVLDPLLWLLAKSKYITSVKR